MNAASDFSKKDLDAYKIGETYSAKCDTIKPYLIGSYTVGKGGGSAEGGKWRPNPNKPDDARFLGEPGEIKSGEKDGYRYEIKIGEDGRAVVERHYTDHNKPWSHTNPHDYFITWNNPTGHPEVHGPTNYPDGAPEFKGYGGIYLMSNTTIPANTPEQNRFVSISDFKDCMRWGGEVEFLWNNVSYSITHIGDEQISISVSFKQETEKIYDTADDALEYMVGSDRLRDVITKVTVLDRTI